MYPDRKNCRDGFNVSERLTTSRNQEEATATRLYNVMMIDLLSIVSIPLTRSQAVARIADRTAKNCKGHVT